MFHFLTKTELAEPEPLAVLGCALKLVFSDFQKFQMGTTGVQLLSNRDETLSHDTAMTSSCSGGGYHGAWGLGRWEKVEKCFIFGPLLFDLFANSQKKIEKKLTKSVNFARIEL